MRTRKAPRGLMQYIRGCVCSRQQVARKQKAVCSKDFPGGLTVDSALPLQGAQGFSLWLGNQDPTCLEVQRKLFVPKTICGVDRDVPTCVPV